MKTHSTLKGLLVLAIAKAAILRPWVWCFLALLAEDVVVGTGAVKTVAISEGAEISFAPQLELTEVVCLFNSFCKYLVNIKRSQIELHKNH